MTFQRVTGLEGKNFFVLLPPEGGAGGWYQYLYLVSRPSSLAFSHPPVTRLSLVIQVPDARDVRSVPLSSCPFNGIVLGLEGGEDVVCLVFGYIVGDVTSFRSALGASFNVDVRHTPFLLRSLLISIENTFSRPDNAAINTEPLDALLASAL